MILVYEKYDVIYAKNLNSISAFAVLGNELTDYGSGSYFVQYESNEKATIVFNDIIEAMIADQAVYDTRKEVGYWKAKKPGPKAKPKAPAREHQEPAPKK